MFQHIGMLTLQPSATADQITGIVDGLRALVDVVPGLERADVAPDAGLADGNASLMFTMTFGDQAGWEAYRTHPAHVGVITEHIAPVLVSKVFVQVAAGDVRTSVATEPSTADAAR